VVPPDSTVCAELSVSNDLHPNVTIDLGNRRSLLQNHLTDRSNQIINYFIDITHNISKTWPYSSPRVTRRWL